MQFRDAENKDNLTLRGKKVLVMGLGLHGGGVGAVKFLLKAGALVTITDLRKRGVLKPSLDKLRGLKNIKFSLGHHEKKEFGKADVILKNPAVLPDSPYLKYAESRGISITSDIAIFLKNCQARVIGITGTRGKSTTASILTEFLKLKFRRVFIGGNIRKSVLELLPRLKKNDWVILELSSFQLHDLGYEKSKGISPHVAIITNILRDHLNWHKNFSEYIRAKSNIFKFQGPDDYLFLNSGDLILRGLAKKAYAEIIFPTLEKKYRSIVAKNLGRHYFSSVALAIAAAKKLGVKDSTIKKLLKKYKGLEGREETISVISGVHFINDTTATSPDAAIAAIERFKKSIPRNGKLVLIAGGQDKKLNFREMARTIVKHIGTLVLLPGTATEKLRKELRTMSYGAGKLNPALDRKALHHATKTNIDTAVIPRRNRKTFKGVVKFVKSMREAVKTAYLSAKKGDYIILSPGAASFGLFLNEFDRGERFILEVKRLKLK